jgi:pyruvate-formate lyase-activating enzyme
MVVPSRGLADKIEKVTRASWGYLDAVPKLRAHPERMAQFMAGKDDRITPVNLEAWPSLTCNARCPGCPYRRNLARKVADATTDSKFFMPLELWSKIAQEFKQVGGLSVTLTGGGEPTENPQLPEFGRIARQEGLYWGLYTNGYQLKPALVDRVLEHGPEYVRVSVNSWSPTSHDQVYHLGLDAYAQVQENLAYLAQHAPSTTTIGIGYVLDHVLPEQLAGMADFITSVVRQSNRLDYAAIRPSVLYYANGVPLKRQPRAERFASVPDLCRHSLSPVCDSCGVSLQVNDRGFQAIAEFQAPSSCLATQWATSATQAGQLYLLSEANGSPEGSLAELCYGDVSGTTTFTQAWFSDARKRLSREFANGERLTPVWHKLSGIDEVLKALRCSIGIVDQEVADEVAKQFAASPRAAHWMFI